MYVVRRSHHNPILIPDRDHYWEAFATFNLSVIKKDREYYGVYRAISAIDKMRAPQQLSIIGIGKSKDGRHFGERAPFIVPLEEWEEYGCEDPRITFFEDNYYIFYTALSKYPFEASGIRVAVAVSKDLKKIRERHLVTPFNAKAMTLFPERIGGKITVIVAVNTDTPPSKIAIAEVDKMEELWNPIFWEKWYKDIDEHTIDLKRFPSDHIEVGTPPLKTKEGYLLFYSHIQNYFPSGENLSRVFGVEAVILDINNPLKIIGRTSGPLLVPGEPYELLGHVSDIVFPTGAIFKKPARQLAGGDIIFLYYGAADTTSCVAYINLNDLMGTILLEKSSKWHFERSLKNPIITPEQSHFWEAKATFNPAVLRIRNTTHILYRALSEDNTSYIGYASTRDGITIDERLTEPIYSPREDFELKKIAGGNSGCEDPRLTKIGHTIYMCYTAYDSVGPPRVAITSISEKDFLEKRWKWEKPILITPEGFDDKDTCILPEKINGQYFIVHRVGNEICGDYFKSLDFTKEKIKKCIRIIGPRINAWDSSKVGITAPPIKTKNGWLLFYHGVSHSHNVYRIGAALLDLNDPAIVISRTADPIFEPKELYEKVGVVNNVVFPCGVAQIGKVLYMYYGAADKVVGVATIELSVVLKALTRDIAKRK